MSAEYPDVTLNQLTEALDDAGLGAFVSLLEALAGMWEPIADLLRLDLDIEDVGDMPLHEVTAIIYAGLLALPGSSQ